MYIYIYMYIYVYISRYSLLVFPIGIPYWYSLLVSAYYIVYNVCTACTILHELS